MAKAAKQENKTRTRNNSKTRRPILDAAAEELSKYGFPGARVGLDQHLPMFKGMAAHGHA